MRGSPDPFEQMEAMFEQMRRSAFGPSERGIPLGPALAGESTTDARVTVEENDDEYVVLADLPGFERDEIDLTLADDTLRITGTHEVADDEEYRSRTVHESVRVPGDVVVEDVAATYRNGVLEVTLPVAASSDEYRIDVE